MSHFPFPVIARRGATGATDNLAVLDAEGDPANGAIAKVSVAASLLGTLPLDIASKTGTFSIGATECVKVANVTGSAFAANLPSAATAGAGKFFVIILNGGGAGGNALTITPAAGTINGAATLAVKSGPPGQPSFVFVITDGTNWVANQP